MHISSIVCLVILAAMAAHQAFAAGNVLLPSHGNEPTASSLGLAPNDGTPATPSITLDSAAPAAVNTIDGAPAGRSAPPPEDGILPSLSSASLPYTPGPPAADMDEARGIPTTVIKQPPVSYAAMQAQFPYVISIRLSGKSIWVSGDLDRINNRLGIARNRVASQCRVSLTGLLMTDKGAYPFDTGLSPGTDAHYDGALSNAMVQVQAVCDAGPLPPNSGLVIQAGDKYVATLGNITCAPPARSQAFQQIAVLYAGNSDTRCAYK
jgi:hypothetical protein